MFGKMKTLFFEHKLLMFAIMGWGIAAFYMWPRHSPDPTTSFFKLDEYVGVSGSHDVDKKTLDAKIKTDFGRAVNASTVNDATYLIRSYSRYADQADLIYVKDGVEKYLFQEIRLKAQNGKPGPAIGYVMIFPSGKITSGVYEFKIKAATAIADDGSRQITNAAQLVMMKSGLANRHDSTLPDWKGAPYNVEILDAQQYYTSQGTSKVAFDFRPDLSVSGVVSINQVEGDVLPGIGVSFISLQKANETTMRFLRIGLGGRSFSNGLDYSISPVLFNLHTQIKFMHNTYVGPTIGYDKRGVNAGAIVALTF